MNFCEYIQQLFMIDNDIVDVYEYPKKYYKLILRCSLYNIISNT